MTSSKFAYGLAGLTLAALMSSAALADKVALKADLSTANEVPPITGAGKGTATLSYDTATKMLTWDVTYTGLSGNPTAGHLHGPADKDKNAAVAVPFTGSLASPIKGSATLTDAQTTDLLAGRYYVNIHTAAHPPGEIRGQVTK